MLFLNRPPKLITLVLLAIALLLLGLNRWLPNTNKIIEPAASVISLERDVQATLSNQTDNASNQSNQKDILVKPTVPPTTEKTVEKTPATQPVQIPSSPAAKSVATNPTPKYTVTEAFKAYQPKYTAAIAHPSNYGNRYKVDARGNPLTNPPLAVLHETVGSARSAFNTFRRPNTEKNQVSYHVLITLDGTIVYFVPADKRAFGAGNSVFKSAAGVETVQTNPNLPSSVNNFAYHISLETPPDGRGKNSANHSGYTDEQYKSLAWLMAMSSIPDERITTHKAVDRSGLRSDPRNFDFDKFFAILHSYRQPS